jgi:uncharacterized protein
MGTCERINLSKIRTLAMQYKNTIAIIISAGLLSILANSCGEKKREIDQQAVANKASNKIKTENMTKSYNPVVYFEIPVLDINRAMKFYSAVFNVTFTKEIIDKNEMALFPFADSSSGISGAFAKGGIYKPTKDGVLIYFKSDNIDQSLTLATENGGKILYPKTSNGSLGFVAEFEDSEGNRIALHQALQ